VTNQRLETERTRAKTAYQYAEDGLKAYPERSSEGDSGGGANGEKYKSIVNKLPARILNNSLGGTVAFHFSKSKKVEKGPNAGDYNMHGYICDQLRLWLHDQGYVSSTTIPDFARDVVALSPADSRAATNEALAFLTWLRRFTDGLSSQSNHNSGSDGSTGES